MYGVATVAGAAITGPHIVRAAEVNKEKIRVGCVGCNGKGSSDVDQVAGAGGEVFALCDVDENNVNNKGKKFPNAQKFNDFRKMFDKVGKDIDAVTVSIPDHNHGIVAGTALKMGKHV
jgi:predicted dehydrogenase